MIRTVIRPEPPAFLWGHAIICAPCAWVIAYNLGLRLEPYEFAADTLRWSCHRCDDSYRRRQRAQP